MTTDTPTGTKVARRHRPLWPVVGPWPLARLLHGIWPAPTAVDGDSTPQADVRETDDTFITQLDLPGVERDALTVDVTGRCLQIRGERRHLDHDGVLRHSGRPTGTFAYEVVLPLAIDEKRASAHLVDGVLTVTTPKAPAPGTIHVAVN